MHSTFYAYLTRLRWIKRWGLMRNAYQENVMEHSWEVATIAHALALIKNRYFGGALNADAVAAAALYHDATEVLTGDLPTPIKYHSAAIRNAYKTIERQAGQELLQLLPEELRADYRPLFDSSGQGAAQQDIVKAADKIAGYLKCRAELNAGNLEFEAAAEELAEKIRSANLPEVDFFMRVFAPSCGLSLDRLVGKGPAPEARSDALAETPQPE
jgi:5'-deoxynucleotidase